MPIVIAIIVCLVLLCRADALVHKHSSLPRVAPAISDSEVPLPPRQQATYSD